MLQRANRMRSSDLTQPIFEMVPLEDLVREDPASDAAIGIKRANKGQFGPGTQSGVQFAKKGSNKLVGMPYKGELVSWQAKQANRAGKYGTEKGTTNSGTVVALPGEEFDAGQGQMAVVPQGQVRIKGAKMGGRQAPFLKPMKGLTTVDPMNQDRADRKKYDDQQAQKPQDELSTGSDKLNQKRADIGNSRRKEKSKQGGVVTDLAKDKATFKPGKLVSHPNGLFYQLQKDRSYAEVSGVIKNKATGELKAGPQGIQYPEDGFNPIQPNTRLGKDLVALTQDPNAEVDKGIVQKAKDAAKDAVSKGAAKLGMDNLAAKTRSDPDASTAQRVGATVGAGIGRAMANVLRRPKGQPADKKQMSNVGKLDMTAFQSRIMKSQDPAEKLALATDMLDKITVQKSRNISVEPYLDSLGPMLKSSGLQKTNPQEYQALVTKARGMREAAFNYFNKLIETVGITWEQLGYKVVLSENKGDDIILIPTKDIELHQLNSLAGV